jgi:hypothetical protein
VTVYFFPSNGLNQMTEAERTALAYGATGRLDEQLPERIEL